MTVSRKMLCYVYGLIALVAFIGTWGNILAYLDIGFIGATVLFWKETLVNPASQFITVDVLFLGLAVIVWAVLEARRLGIRGIWIYVAGSLLIAISVAIPLFLIHRERALASAEPESAAGTLTLGDAVALVVLGVVILGYTAITLMQ